MLFNSWTFLLFSLVVFPLYFLFRRSRVQNVIMLIASYIFYGSWDWRFLFLLLASTVVDYFVGKRLEETSDSRTRKILLTISCAVNLGILGFFKYFDFFVGNLEAMIASFGFDPGNWRLDLILPVGISFYTFQTMAYSIDVYRRHIPAERDFITFALFVSFFPQLVAGPIERASHLIPQLKSNRLVNFVQLREGAWLILFGLFKKVVVADNLGMLVDEIFSRPDGRGGLLCLLGIYAFAYQIYGDFSGYSDIARGLSKLLGIDLMVNFRLPYLARNPQDFWQRWHISLSTWLRDYLYIPLGGNRHGKSKTYRNLLITMILGGLWHGAAWNFVLWGVFHGVALAIHRRFFVERNFHPLDNFFGRIVQAVFWFHLTCLGWLLFRLPSVHDILNVSRQIAFDFHLDRAASQLLFTLLFFVGLLWVFESWIQNVDDPAERPGWQKGLGPIAVTVILICLIVFSPQNTQPFLYFQF